MDASPQSESLFQKLGGEHTIAVVVEAFYSRILGDPTLAPMFQTVDLSAQKRHMVHFLSQALGGPKQYQGRDIKAAHQGLGITPEQFDQVAHHLVETLNGFDVDLEYINQVVALVAPLKELVVEPQPRSEPVQNQPPPGETHAAPSPPPGGHNPATVVGLTRPGSLFTHLGGWDAVDLLVRDWFGLILQHPVLNPAFEGKDHPRIMENLKFFLGRALGGPDSCQGEDIRQVHHAFKVTRDQFDAMVSLLNQALDRLNLGEETTQRVVAVFLPIKSQIVNGSLFSRLGGEAVLKGVIDDFYGRVMKDPLVAVQFHGKDLGRLKGHLVKFVSQALGGPGQYDGPTLFDAHKKLAITDEQFNRVVQHLGAALEKFQVGQKEISQVVELLAPLKPDISMTPFQGWLRDG